MIDCRIRTLDEEYEKTRDCEAECLSEGKLKYLILTMMILLSLYLWYICAYDSAFILLYNILKNYILFGYIFF